MSYDAGNSWIGGFVPGLDPFDTSPASLNGPGRLEGATDPVLLSAPCGRFYLIYLQFTRGDISRLMAALITDTNDSDIEHTFHWEYATIIAEAKNANFGPFNVVGLMLAPSRLPLQDLASARAATGAA